LRAALPLISVLLVATPGTTGARIASDENGPWTRARKDPYAGVYEIAGEGFVHNVGNLWVNITNLGVIGNPFKSLSTDPSAQYPPGSGTEYLYGAGIWIGARMGSDPVAYVSTSFPDLEFRPTLLPAATIYESYEGFPGGGRFVNDDGDTDEYGREKIDEEFHDGLDNDGDGLIDEDFAAISQQMFTCVYRDDTDEAMNSYEEHVPMGLEVVQESYAWGIPGSDNFVGIQFTIKNEGRYDLHDVYLGFFCDGDAGPEGLENYWMDDRAGLVLSDTTITTVGTPCSKKLRLMIGEIHDGDTDGGSTEGWLGLMFLGHTTDPTGRKAPPTVGFTSFRFVSGSAAYEQCGDPDDDLQRYDLLSSGQIGCRPSEIEAKEDADYRVFFGTGPFKELPRGETLTLQVALVIGVGREGMKRNAVAAQRIYNGTYQDLDENPDTGVNGRETCLTAEPGEPVQVFDYLKHCDVPESLVVILGNLPEFRPISITEPTCETPAGMNQYVDFDCDPCTGVDGKETVVHWQGSSTPPCPQVVAEFPQDETYPCHTLADRGGHRETRKINGPAVQLIPGDNKVTIRWNNASELVPDPLSKEFDFAGYRVWKAEQWGRPVGSTGPAPELWSLLAEYRSPQYLEPNSPQQDIAAAINPDPSARVPCDTLAGGGQMYLYPVGYYQHEDTHVLNGFVYFYAVTAFDMNLLDEANPVTGEREQFSLECPRTASETQAVVPRKEAVPSSGKVFVVPNPYYGSAAWDLTPNAKDPTGTHVDFMNLPRGPWTIHIYTLAGDLVRTIKNDGSSDVGQAKWDLVTRKGQDVASGVYIYCVESRYGSQVGKFVILRADRAGASH